MRVALVEAGVPVEWHDIWADPNAAAFVRSVAGGNETVPTVRIGGHVLVGPSPKHVLAELRAIDPGLVVSARRWPPLRLVQWIAIFALLMTSVALGRSGQTGLSWLANGAAIAVYLGIRRLRSRPRRQPSALAHR